MNARTLGALQIAALLVSASYGIGFLFGSGEMALRHGMAASVYGIATAAGMVLLAVGAKALWKVGGPVWDVFGRAYGEGMRQAVALLSLVWMAGVLAAQIHGGLAIAQQLGLPMHVSFAVVIALIFAASLVDLGLAAALFGACLLSSAAVLMFALITFDGLSVYIHSLPRFAADLATFRAGQLLAVFVAVTLLVCTGADYQQFVIAARTPGAAWRGCVLAASCLVAMSFLPPAVVVALVQGEGIAGMADAKQVIPFALEKAASIIGPGFGVLMLMALSAAALGSGAAILRAMTQALQSALSRRWSRSSSFSTMISLLVGATLASRGQGIVETMVSVNTVYLASIGVILPFVLAGQKMPQRLAYTVMTVGFLTSTSLYLARWVSGDSGSSDLQTMTLGLLASASVLLIGLAIHFQRRRVAAGQ